MSDVILRDADGHELMTLTQRQQVALADVLEAQIQIDDAKMFIAGPTSVERDFDMHGDRRPVQDGDAVIWPIACRASELAQRRDDELPKCRWVRDGEGVACTRCGKAEAPGMVRHDRLRAMVDGIYSPEVRRVRRGVDG